MPDLLQDNQFKKYVAAWIALFIIPISGLSIDIYIPSLPAIGHYFNADKALAQLTVSFYMIGLGIMQLFAGALSDSFGRKKPFMIAISGYILATLAIPFANVIYQLLALRLFQGIMVAILIVPIRSVFSDLFNGKALQKMMTYMVMAWSIGPIIAPVIGGYLQFYFGWQANFYFLGIYSAIAFLLVALFLPETGQHSHPFKFKPITKRSLEILSHREFLSGLLFNGLLYSLIILFTVVGPFLIQNILHYSAVEFGNVVLFIGLAWFAGSMTNRFLIHVTVVTKTKTCFWIMFIIAALMILIAIYLPMTIYTIMVPVCLIIWLGGIVFPNYFALSVTLFPQATGSANALFGAFISIIAGVSASLGTLLKSSSQLPLAISYITLISLCLGTVYINQYSKLCKI